MQSRAQLKLEIENERQLRWSERKRETERYIETNEEKNQIKSIWYTHIKIVQIIN